MEQRVYMEGVGRTDPGRIRPQNEDAFLVRDDLPLYVVADGMGGAAAGEIASQLFVRAVEEIFLNGLRRSVDRASLVLAAFRAAHGRIQSDANRHPPYQGMGCTAEILTFDQRQYYLGHVGDSRTYLWDGRDLRLLTRDHTYVQDQLDKRIISEEEARHHRFRHVLSRAVGHEDVVEVDQHVGPLTPESLFLLCSDGLSGQLSDSAIAGLLRHSGTLAERVDALVEAAKEAGGRDNITVILCRMRDQNGRKGPFGFLERWGGRWPR